MSETVQSATKQVADQLKSLIRPLDQRWFEAELLVGFVLKQERTWIALHPTAPVSKKQLKTCLALATRRAQHEPLAYIFEQAPFFGLSFFVNKHVLIPRAESEWLVQTALDTMILQRDWVAWDVGTGSGCLGLSVAHAKPGISVLASDTSLPALAVAQKNRQLLKQKNLQFARGSLLSPNVRRWLKTKTDQHWLIIANLPYLPLSDRTKLQAQVVDHEPAQALFAEDKGLALIKQLLEQLQRFLTDRRGDVILLEHDPRQAKELAKFAARLFPEATVSTEKDQNGANRFTVLRV